MLEECDYKANNVFIKFGNSNIGQCRIGTSICTSQCKWSLPFGVALADIEEVCGDGLDNDCNGFHNRAYSFKKNFATVINLDKV